MKNHYKKHHILLILLIAHCSLLIISISMVTGSGIYSPDEFDKDILREREILQGGEVETLAGSGMPGYTDGKGMSAQFNWPTGMIIDNTGNIYITDFNNHKIRKITPKGEVTTFAGSGIPGYMDGPGNKAQFYDPNGLTIDKKGNLYVVDGKNHRIRKISPEGMVSTFVGSGIPGYLDGPGKIARFNYPTGIAIDKDENLYIADRRNHTLRKVAPDGTVSTLAGNGKSGYMDGRGREALFHDLINLMNDTEGNLYVGDSFNNVIRKVTQKGEVTTFAGRDLPGKSNGPRDSAQFNWPTGVAIDNLGNIYIADSNNNSIRKIDRDGNVSTLAGIGYPGFADGPRRIAHFKFPTGIAVDRMGNVYVSDSGNHRIRKIIPTGRVMAMSSVLVDGL